MKVAIYQGIKDIEMKEVDMPICGDNDIVIKNIYAAICGSDITAYYHGGDANRIFKGYEFGHEMVSEVVTVGKNVQDFKVGQIVYPYPLSARGDSSRTATLGGFSQYILCPNVKLNQTVYAVSNKISLKTASLIEPFTVGTRAARRSRPQAGETAIVFGAGAIGISAAIALKYFGCQKVMIVDLSDFRLEKCAKLGFETCNSSKENLKEKHDSDAKYGWYRYDTKFALPVYNENQGLERFNVFQAVLLIRHAQDGKLYLYDLVNIKKETGKPLEQ